MARTPAVHLRDALDAIKAIESYTQRGRKAFDRDPMMRDAVCARLMQIGQAVKYALLDETHVWSVVEKDLRPLRRALEALLKRP